MLTSKYSDFSKFVVKYLWSFIVLALYFTLHIAYAKGQDINISIDKYRYSLANTATSITINVPATSAPINTELNANNGDLVVIFANGVVHSGSTDPGYKEPSTPDGLPLRAGNPYGTPPLPNISTMSLIANIGGNFSGDFLLDDGRDINSDGISGTDVGYPGLYGPGYVGSNFAGIAKKSGTIFVAVNDAPLSDNSGNFQVTITIIPQQAWPNLDALQQNYNAKKGTNEAPFAHQFYCIATKSCEEYNVTGNDGWGGEFVKYLFNYMLGSDGLTKSVNVKCSPELTNSECFELAADTHRSELIDGFSTYCVEKLVTNTQIDYTEWDTDHNQFLDNAVSICFDEVAAEGELSDKYAKDKKNIVIFLAKTLRETVQALCTLSEIPPLGSHITASSINDFPPFPTRDDLYNSALDESNALSVTEINNTFFLTVGATIQLQVLQKNTSQPVNGLTFSILNASSDVAIIDSEGVLTITGTLNPIDVLPQSLYVLATTNGVDQGIGQFAITGVDTDKDHILDLYESKFGLDSSLFNSVTSDLDKDQVTDVLEVILGTLPLNADSDEDGVKDGIEIVARSNPLDSHCTPGNGCQYFAYLPLIQHDNK